MRYILRCCWQRRSFDRVPELCVGVTASAIQARGYGSRISPCWVGQVPGPVNGGAQVSSKVRTVQRDRETGAWEQRVQSAKFCVVVGRPADANCRHTLAEAEHRRVIAASDNGSAVCSGSCKFMGSLEVA